MVFLCYLVRLHILLTEEAIRFLNLIPTDVGRPLSDIVTKVKYDKMIEDAASILQTLQYRETDVQLITANGITCVSCLTKTRSR